MDEVIDLLQAWGLPELEDSFKKNQINIHSLAALSNEDIKELIPQLGPRSLFIRCWKVWQAEFSPNFSSCNISLSDIPVLTVDDFEQQTSSEIFMVTESLPVTQDRQVTPEIHPSSSSDPHSTHDVFIDNILVKLLNNDFEASSLLKFVGKALENDSARNLLASTIVKEILKENKNLPITNAIYNKWIKEIKNTFPSERITTYYIPPCVTAQGITHQSRGKLVSQLLNIRRKYQKLGVLDVKERKKTQNDNTINGMTRPLPASYIPNPNLNNSRVEEDLAWLKSSSDPWPLVVCKWKETLNRRTNDLRDPNYSIETYFDNYPAINKPMGYKLLVSDFEDTYSENINNFYLNFPTIRLTLIELLKKKGTKDNYRNELTQLADSSSEENQNIAAILSLPELIKSSVITLPAKTASDTGGDSPAPLKKRKTKEHKWKPTKAEHREAFVTHVEDDSYFKVVINKKHHDIMEKGFTPQPYIVIVGSTILNIKSYYVVLNPNIFYNLPNILASIDTCFKITWALNLEYSPSCYGPWLFLQKGLYKLSSPYDKGSTPVESLMTDCKLAN